MPPPEHDPDALRSVAGEIERNVKQLRWLRDCVKQLYEEQNPHLADVRLEVSTVEALTPVLAKALVRVAKALEEDPPPRSGALRRRRQ